MFKRSVHLSQMGTWSRHVLLSLWEETHRALKDQVKVAPSCSFHGKINQMFQMITSDMHSWQFIDCVLQGCFFKPVHSEVCLAVAMTSTRTANPPPPTHWRRGGLLTFTVFLPSLHFRNIPPWGLLVPPLTLSWFAMKYRGGVDFPSEPQLRSLQAQISR